MPPKSTSKPPLAVKPAKTVTVTGKKKGTEITLGDGRTLNFGESAEVSAELAAQLQAAGLV